MILEESEGDYLKDLLEHAMITAASAHMGQLDKGGQPYILHPIRVMLQCGSMEERAAALLHDVLEDTPLTAAELAAEGFPREVLEAVVCLTRVRDEDYAVYIERVCGNRLAAAVKLADLTDNMDLNRLPGLTQRDFQRLERYIRAKRRVEQALEEWDERGDKHG
ncbi:MAG: GTP pyrophosphokinase [Anaerotignum sp.]|nr:GTP pyrophosphokinase [Anaerotignum sp.]